MGVAVKKLMVVIVFAGILSAPAQISHAAIKCEKTSAKGHTPKDVTAPKDFAKKMSKKLTLKTNCGDIEITTVGSKTPATNTVMTLLAKAGYFDNSLCHRLTTQGLFVLQCGDPTATGGGGPKFRYQDENLPTGTTNNYPEGTVAMANSGANTNGSQFFLVYKDTTLGPNYTIWGKITKGLDIVKYVAGKGVVGGGGDGAPKQTIAIKKVLVS